jgi:tetratricopeptide (TPR) repeat protein
MKPGEVIHDRFVLERFIARGGMGEVYRAIDSHTQKPVALKVLRSDDDELAERLGMEARALIELNHPAIVRYVAHGNAPAVGVYLAMEWLEGAILPTRLKRQPLTVDETLALCARIADGLGAAHRLGMVHRDVKPANLFLVDDRVDQVKVLDFGIVRNPWQSLTETGHGLGTPEYMAPEQARCERTLGPPADVFALGCVLFRCLAGRAAFRGDTPGAVVAQIATLRAPPRLSDVMELVPRLVDDLVARLMAPAAADRPADGHAAAELILTTRAELRRNAARAEAWRTPTPSLTSIEQQPVALLFIDADEATAASRPAISLAEAVAPTTPVLLRASGEPILERDTDENAPPPALGVVRQALEPFGARLEVLANGSMLAMLVGGATAADLAVRAARCALAVHAVLPRASIALVTRRAVADDLRGAVAVMERPAGMSPSRRIRVDRGTRELLPEHFEIGGDEAEGFILRAEKPPEGVPRRLLGRAMPYVGRQAVLRRLLAAVDGAIEENAAGAVVVVGEAGVGKSRLRAELLDRVRAGEPRTALLHGWGDPMRSGVPYGVLARALRSYLGIATGPSPAQQEALLARVAAVPEPDRQRVAEFLGQLVGVPLAAPDSPALRAARKDPQLMAQQKARAWQDWLAAECAARPVMLVIDDLHAADAPSVELVGAGLRRAVDLPFFVLAFARPEVHVRFPRLGEEWARDEVRLEPLRAAHSAELVRQVLGEAADEALVHQLVERSAGNPFYLEELIRSAVAGDSGAPPESVIASVQLRIGKLPVRARQVLRAASVFGKVFWTGGVAAMLGDELSPAELDEWIDVLEREELVERRPASRALAGEVELAFRHDLVRDAAYQMLVPGDRMVGHRLAGSWLQAHGETDALVLAEHFAGGGAHDQAVEWFARAAERALAGGEMADALGKAATYYHRAGATCAAAYANGSAEEYFERAVALWSTLDPAEAARTRLELAALRERTGERDRALEDLRLAEEALGDGHEETRIEILLRRANLEMRGQGEGVLERARRTAKEALERARRSGSRELEARALILMAVLIWRLEAGESSNQAIELVERALSLAQSPGAIAEGLWRLGNAFLFGNDLDRAAGMYREALAAAEAAGDDLLMAMCSSNHGMVSFRRWHLDDAIEQTRRARALYERIGHRTRLLEMTLNLGAFLQYRGDSSAARPLLEQVLMSARGDWILTTLSREVLADIARLEGREQQAQEHLASAARLAESVGVASRQAFFLGLLAESCWATGDVAAVVDALERGAQAARGLTLSHAFLLLHLGSLDEAIEWLARFADAEPDPQRRAAARLGLARAHWWSGDTGEALRICGELRRFLAPTPAPRFTIPAMLLESCVAGQAARALALLEQAATRCAPYERAELALDIATLLASGGEPEITRRFLEISGDVRHRGILYRVEALRSDLFARLDRNEEARTAFLCARQELEWLSAALSGEYRERLQENPWVEALGRLRSVP